MVVQSTLVDPSPFTFIVSPRFANYRQPRVVILRFYKRATRGRHDIRQTTEVLHCCFAKAVSGRGHVERASLFFTVVESQLGERQMRSQLIHGSVYEEHLLAAYSLLIMTS